MGANSRNRIVTLLRVVIAVLAVLLLAAGGFYWWAATPLGPNERALSALQSDEIVLVTQTDDRLEFTPADDEVNVGLILYPGGRVDFRSYAPLAREIASRGYLVVIVKMPLNLAVLDSDRADDVMAEHPDIITWSIGGHSLGGAMAAAYTAENTETVAALALMAAYPPSNSDLSGCELAVTSIVGNLDTVVSGEALVDSVEVLPDDAVFEVIEGGNHAQFGSYGEQPGDTTAAITAEQQQLAAARSIALMLRPFRLGALSR